MKPSDEEFKMDSGCAVLLVINSENTLLTVPFDPVTWNVKLPMPEDVAVPDTMPAELSVRPPKMLDVVHVHGLLQFGADSVWLYGTPTTADGNTPSVVIANGSTVSVNDELSVFDAVSLSVTRGKKLPDDVGVPESRPEALIVMPAGRFVADQV